MPFEEARTALCFGKRLRRSRRRVDARHWLRTAAERFDTLGAEPWAASARRELAATGARLGPRNSRAAREQLTPQEVQIARVVAEGVTNQEAAAQLFLSPKTIETHLTRIYRKLGIRSRAELVGKIGEISRS